MEEAQEGGDTWIHRLTGFVIQQELTQHYKENTHVIWEKIEKSLKQWFSTIKKIDSFGKLKIQDFATPLMPRNLNPPLGTLPGNEVLF